MENKKNIDDDEDYKPLVMNYLNTIADEIKKAKYEYKTTLHIIKHISNEMQRMVIEEGRMEDFINSEMNLIFLFKIVYNMELIDWKGMYERLQNHANKKKLKVFNVLENGDVIDSRKLKIGSI